MIGKLSVVAGVLFLTSATVHAQDWLPLGETDGHRWDGRAGTRQFSKNRSGVDISVAAGRVYDKKTTQFTFEKWYVTSDDCSRGMGKVITTDMEGNYKYENEFVEKGGSVASSLAQMLCFPILEARDVNSKKGL